MLQLTLSQEAAQWQEKAAQCAAAFAERLSEAAIALPQMACGLYLLTLGHPRQVGVRQHCSCSVHLHMLLRCWLDP